MSDQIRFRVRPAYKSENLLIQIVGNHRSKGFPDLALLLVEKLGSKRKKHPKKLDSAEFALMTDNVVSYWEYPGGQYEVDDDWGGLFVLAETNNKSVISDIEQALLRTGHFVREAVDYEQYR